MKGYMNHVLSHGIQTIYGDIREVIVEARLNFRTSLADTMLSRSPDLAKVLRFQPSFILDGISVHAHANSLMVWRFGTLGAIGMPLLTPQGEVIPNTMDIYYDSKFKSMPRELQDAVFAHEVGHFKLGHNQKLLQGWVPSPEEAFEMECEADAYAVSMGYDIHSALRFMIFNYRKSMKLDAIKMTWQRLNRIAQQQLVNDLALNDPNVPSLFNPSGTTTSELLQRHPTLKLSKQKSS